MKKRIGLLAILFFLAGCSPLGVDVPEGFTKKSYEELVEAYRYYEKSNIENERKDDLLDFYPDYKKRADKGELTKQEVFVSDSIGFLVMGYIAAHSGLSNEAYKITELIPNKLTFEVMGGIKLEKIKETEKQILSHLQLEPLPRDEKDEKMKRKVHKESLGRLMNAIGIGEIGTATAYEDSLVVYRKDRDEYYVASSFSYNGELFKYDMIMDSELYILDAYIVGTYGELFNKPMNEDNRPQWLASIKADGESEEQLSISEEDIDEDAKTPLNQASSEEVDLPEWNKQEYLGGTILDIGIILETIRLINSNAMSLELDVNHSNETLLTLSYLRDDLFFMLNDPTTSQHFSDSEKESVQIVLNGIDAAIEAEQQMINDPSTGNIRLADSMTEEVQVIVSSIQFDY